MSRETDPHRLDLPGFTAAAGVLGGESAQAGFGRLAGSLLALPGDGLAPPPVVWAAKGEQRAQPGGGHTTWLHLHAQTRVTLQCQRCLQPMQQPLVVDRWFRFAGDEDEAARLDEDSEEDVLVGSKRFDLVQLLEDELILALPIVPRHDACPQPLASTVGEAAEDLAPNPFAVLTALRRTPPGN